MMHFAWMLFRFGLTIGFNAGYQAAIDDLRYDRPASDMLWLMMANDKYKPRRTPR